MTKDDVIEMAREAEFPIFGTKFRSDDPMQQMLANAVTEHYHESAIKFAKLVAEAERESCAMVADEWIRAYPYPSERIAEMIRARGKT